MEVSQWHGLPSKPGVYIYKDVRNKVIYVGKAKDLKKRVGNYFSDRPHDAKTTKLIAEAFYIDYIVVGSEVEAFLLEAELIKKYRPYYNIQFSDDKYYPFLKIGTFPYPYISVVRKKDKNEKAEYLGPYISSSDLKTTLRLLRRIFPFHSVKNHDKRKCLYNHIRLCPCIPVNPERLDKYKQDIKSIRKFFKGDTKGVIKGLILEQKGAVKEEKFEDAQSIQIQIDKIKNLTSEHFAPFSYEEKPDFYYQRIKSEVKSLQEILSKYDIESSLHRIECYDISNTSGKNATGSMVVFINGDVSKKDYRKFKIKFKKTPDDFAMHMEVMARRIRNDWPKPDLLVIDGGKGQVSSVLKVLAHFNYKVPLIGLAKREEIIVIPLKSKGFGFDFIEVKLPRSTPGVNLLRRIRDEAHRFAITYHKLLRKKALNI